MRVKEAFPYDIGAPVVFEILREMRLDEQGVECA